MVEETQIQNINSARNDFNNDITDSTRTFEKNERDNLHTHIKRKNPAFLAQIWDFLKVRKAWWLTPIIITLLLASILIVFGQSSALSPFIYALF